VLLSLGLLVPGWCLLWLLNLRSIGLALAVPASIGLSLSIVALAAWTAWMTGTGLRGVAVLTVLVVLGAAAAVAVRRSRLATISDAGRLEVGAAVIGAVTAALAVVDGPWLSQDADTFYHLAAARALLRTGDALPHDVFFGVAIPYPDATTGSLHDVLAWLSLSGGMIPAWTAVTILGAAFTALAFLALARELTRSTSVALLATFLYVVLGLQLDMRTSGYPNRIGPGIVWLSMVFLLRYARPETRSWRELLPACALAFTAALIHSGMAPLVVAMVVSTLAAAAVGALRRRPLRFLLPLAVACAAVLLAVLPVLAVRLLGLPGPGPEGSFATQAAAVKVRVLLGYPFIDFRFWFDGFVTVTTVGTLCLLGRARRSLLDGDFGAAMLWGSLLVVPLVCLTPFLTGSASSLYYFVRVSELLAPLLFVTLAWELCALVPPFIKILRFRPLTQHPTSRWLPAAALVVATAYIAAVNLNTGVYDRYFGSDQLTVAASRHNDLTQRWADRLSALDRAGPGAVLADLDSSYELAGLTGRRVVAVPYSHMPFQIEPLDGILRRGDVADALNPASNAYALPSILVRYQVTYVMVDLSMDGQAIWDWMASQRELTTVAQGSGWMLMKFDPGGLDTALRIPLKDGVGVEPSAVPAGRAAFVRVQSTGTAGTATVSVTGLSSTASYRIGLQVPNQSGATVTGSLLVPDFAPVDRYSVAVTLPGGEQLDAGRIEVGRNYEAESFAGVIDTFNGGYLRQPAWVSIYGSEYSRGSAAVAVRASMPARHPLIESLGDYCVAVRVMDTGSGRALALDIGIGSSSVEFSWSDQTAGTQELRQELRSTAGPHELAMWVPAGGSLPVIVDRIDLYPPPLAPATC
jgi:hypothetical protein